MAFLRATVLIALALALVQRQAEAQSTPPPIECEGLSLEPGDLECTPLNNCTGVTCSVGFTLTATLSVEKCTDPLEISVAVTSPGSNGLNILYVFTSSGTQSSGGYPVRLLTSRNASYATIQAYNINGDVIIPKVEIFLDPHTCMCASLEALVESIDSPFETDCSRNPACTGVDCRLDIPIIGTIYELEVDIEACQNPPGALVLLTDVDQNITIPFYFNASREIILPVPGPIQTVNLSVNITHLDYSSAVEIVLEAFGNVYNLLPKQQVILDKSSCPTILPPTDTPTVPPGRAITQETCDALTDIVESEFLGVLGNPCQTTDACDAVSCNLGGFRLFVELLPCEQPPTVYIEISDSNGIIYEKVVNSSSTFINLENIAVAEFVLTQIPTGISIAVKISFPRTTINLIQEHEIPFEVCYCPDRSCTTTTVTSSVASSSPSPTSTSEPTVDRLSAATIAAITVPIILLMVLVAVAIVVAAIVVVVLKRQKSPPEPFPFKSMDAQPEEEDRKDIIESSTNEQETDQADY